MASLPPPAEKQPYVTVSALQGGELGIPLDLIIEDGPPGAVDDCPSLAFLLQHSESKQRFLLDLGIRKDLEGYSPSVQKMVATDLFKTTVEIDVLESLTKGGLSPTEIDYVCLTHLHWDHTGNTEAFTNSTFIIADENRSILESAYPGNPNAYYRSDVVPPEDSGRTRFLSKETWKPVGPFPLAHDFFGDGSVYIVDSPGHMKGHINVLARTSPDGAWIFLAGDSAHHWSLITGEKKVKVGASWDKTFCFHGNLDQAVEHISNIRKVWKMDRVRVLLTHDTPWYIENKGKPSSFFPALIPSL